MILLLLFITVTHASDLDERIASKITSELSASQGCKSPYRVYEKMLELSRFAQASLQNQRDYHPQRACLSLVDQISTRVGIIIPHQWDCQVGTDTIHLTHAIERACARL